jgi:hypothetical protein
LDCTALALFSPPAIVRLYIAILLLGLCLA